MDDYLSIQKIWQDTDFAEFEITGSSPVITAKTAVYMTDSLIDELFRQITRFLSGEVEECCWANKEGRQLHRLYVPALSAKRPAGTCSRRGIHGAG